MADPGRNYKEAHPPSVTISGGRGQGAAARRLSAADGTVKSIEITEGGSGYFYGPTVTIEDPPALGAIQFYLGIDGINVWLVVLTAVLMVPSVLISWNVIHERANEYYAWLLALGTGMLGVFLSFDIILFYVFFELTLVPLFFLIGIWGGPERRHAARKFFIYTLAGSLITFLGLLAIVAVCYLKGGFSGGQHLTFSIPELVTHDAEQSAQRHRPEILDGVPVLGLPGPDRRDSPSRCRWCPCTPGCRWPTSRPRRPAASSWPACCSRWALTASCDFVCR